MCLSLSNLKPSFGGTANGSASCWTRLSRPNRSGRPRKDREIRELIRKMAKANPPYVKSAHMLNQGARCLVGLRGEELALYITFQLA
jgi:hypothetical protein